MLWLWLLLLSSMISIRRSWCEDFTFGKTDVGSSEDWWYRGFVVATNFNCSRSGTLTRISAYIKCASSSNVKVGMWSNLDRSKLAESNAISVGTSFSWVNFSVSASVSVENYWLGFISESENIYFKYDYGFKRTCVDYEGSFALPDVLDTSTAYDQIISIYAAYTTPDEDWRVHNIDSGLNYTTIQAAISASETLNGHTIFVEKGTYYEHIVVDKSLSLIGENRNATIIDGNYTGNVVEITASNVNFTGFTVQRGGSYPNCGISVGGGNARNNISYNFIRDNGYGIRLSASSENVVFGNIASNNRYGIHVSYYGANNISSNKLSSNIRDGIVLYYSSDNTVSGNTVLDNVNVGIYLWYSSDNTIFNNNMSGNTYNFEVYGTTDSDFRNSVATSNMVDFKPIYYLKDVTDSVYGAQTNAGTIYLINCNNITVKDLTLAKNGHGIFLWNTTNSKIENIIASNNSFGIQLSQSRDNVIFHNDFVSNGQQALCYDSANVWNNDFEGNYWSNYVGVDLNNDGVGDSPYEIDTYNVDNHPLMNPYLGHNVAIDNLTLSKNVVGEGYSLEMKLNITNPGSFPETLNLTVYANTTLIFTWNGTLSHLNSTITSLIWNTTGFSKGYYSITANVTSVSGETNLEDNTFNYGIVIVTIPGDFDGDFQVGVYDFALLSVSYGSTPWRPGMIGDWNSNCDVNGDNKIGPYDFAVLSVHYGEHYP